MAPSPSQSPNTNHIRRQILFVSFVFFVASSVSARGEAGTSHEKTQGAQKRTALSWKSPFIARTFEVGGNGSANDPPLRFHLQHVSIGGMPGPIRGTADVTEHSRYVTINETPVRVLRWASLFANLLASLRRTWISVEHHKHVSLSFIRIGIEPLRLSDFSGNSENHFAVLRARRQFDDKLPSVLAFVIRIDFNGQNLDHPSGVYFFDELD